MVLSSFNSHRARGNDTTAQQPLSVSGIRREETVTFVSSGVSSSHFRWRLRGKSERMLLYRLVDGLDEFLRGLRSYEYCTSVRPFDPNSLVTMYVVCKLPRCPADSPPTDLT